MAVLRRKRKRAGEDPGIAMPPDTGESGTITNGVLIARQAFISQAKIGANEIAPPSDIHGVLFVGLEQNARLLRAKEPAF